MVLLMKPSQLDNALKKAFRMEAVSKFNCCDAFGWDPKAVAWQ